MASSKHVDKILLRHIRRNSLSLAAVFGLMLLIVGFDVIAPWPFKILIDNVLSGETIQEGSWFSWLHAFFPSRDLLGFFAVFIYFTSTFALACVEYLKSAFTKSVIRSITADFSKDAFKKLETLAIGFFSKQKLGDYIYRLGYDVGAFGELLEEGVLPLLTSALYLIVTISIMLLISIPLTLLSITALPFLALGLHAFNKRVTQATKRSEYFNSVTFSFLEEALTHLKIIQAFSQEKRESKAFDRRIETSLWSDVVMFRLDFLLSLLVGLIIALSYSIVMLYGIRAVFAGSLTTGLLIVFIFYLDNLANPLLSFIYATTALRQSLTKIRRMEEFFNEKSHLNLSHSTIKKIPHTDIVFENVSVEVEGGKRILHDVSFTIEEGKRTVIFGTSGSGKTSVSNLIMRFIDKPSKGRVLLGGIPIEQYELSALRNSIAYVPQEITLFNDTIRNNIVFGNKYHSWESIRRAAELSAADDFIKKLHGKYSFKVGESGGFLSGGQRQRLMLARALMKEDAPILLFDETFSALDVKTRREVLHNIYNFSKDKTTIIISNIFDVIDAADNIIVMSRGHVLFSGPASRLPKEISLYKMIAKEESAEDQNDVE